MLRNILTRSKFQKKCKPKYDVIIHIGAPKTGSSAIQRFCYMNRTALLANGYYYPKHALDQNGISGGHSVIAGPLIRGELDQASQTFFKLLNRAKSKNACLLLSAEGFYSHAEKFAPFIADLKVKVVAWFRHPVEALVSNYNQSVKRHYATKRLLDVCRMRLYAQQMPHIAGDCLHRWADCVGNDACAFMPYSSGLFSSGVPIEVHWLNLLGVSHKKQQRFSYDAARINRSYVPEALELKRLLNCVLDDSILPICHRVDWALQQYSDKSDQRPVLFNEILPNEYIADILRSFEDSNQSLVARFPLLQPLIDQSEHHEVCSPKSPALGLSLLPVLQSYANQHPEDIDVLRSRIRAKVVAAKTPSYSLAKLADLFDINYIEPPSVQELMPRERLQTMLHDRAALPDLLRESALIMESYGDLQSAIALIVRARDLRPAGPGIIKIEERLKQKLNVSKDEL